MDACVSGLRGVRPPITWSVAQSVRMGQGPDDRVCGLDAYARKPAPQPKKHLSQILSNLARATPDGMKFFPKLEQLMLSADRRWEDRQQSV